MTGYGRAQKILSGRDITVEIRSVNHRYFEYSSRLPRMYGYADEKLKTLVKGSISRGKTEVSVTVNCIDVKDCTIAMNESVALGYITALRDASDRLGLADDLTLSGLLRLPDVFNVRKTPDDEDRVSEDICDVAGDALEKFIAMRAAEGEKLRADVLYKVSNIETAVEKVEKRSPETVENYRKRLYEKLGEILESKDIDEQRILTEAAIFADRIAVDEETVRLRSHISQLREMLDHDEPVGRKLDFLVQEMNREVNTIGSKALDLEISGYVVDMKAELEKIREQIQNVE